jgi:hypothetical protein
MMRAPVRTGAMPTVGLPSRFLHQTYYSGFGVVERSDTYDVAPNGQRFLMLKGMNDPSQPPEAASVVVVKNWADEVRRLLAPR